MKEIREVILAAKQKLNMPQDAKPMYNKSYPLEAQMGMVPLTQPELPNQPEPQPLVKHESVKPIKVY